ncbi:MAG: site-2 protease family protein [Clostridiaceae bacterium]|jgi:Zn-dependent protease|nr:site-2 protease family protein [Clostridiaceae bacterium]
MDFFSLQKFILMTPILFIALPVHELAHGWVAYKLGDPTAKEAGRLTLNPFKHLDLIGVLMMYTVGFGWAKPVPVNFSNLKNRRTGSILVAVAGPMSNILLGFISIFIGGIIAKLFEVGVITISTEKMLQVFLYVALFFYILVSVNINLAIFNMIPVPPLDGSRLISGFIPEEAFYKFARYEAFIGLAFFALVVLVPNDFLSSFIRTVANPIFRSMAFTTGNILNINPDNVLWRIMQGVIQ